MTFDRKLLKTILGNVLFFTVFIYSIHLYQTRNSPTGLAPELKGSILNGQVFEGLSQMDKPVLVHFWATWCKICEFEHGNISNIAKDYSVVGIASQSGSLSDVKAYVKEHEISYPVLFDGNSHNSKAWNIIGYPTSFIVGKDNQITFTEVGFTSEFGIRMRLWASSLSIID